MPEFTVIDGKVFKPLNIPATGAWQLLQMESVGCYILVDPNGRQAWFHQDEMAKVSLTIPGFRYTSQPMHDLRRLAKAGLRPFHVDADFDVAGLTAQ